MKTATLLQSFLLAAGLMLGGIPAVQADRPHSDAPAHGNYHNLQHNKHGSGHTPWWSSSRHGKHNPKNHGNHGRDNGLRYRHWLHDRHGDHGDRHKYGDSLWHDRHDGHGDRWKHGKYDGHDDGHDHKDYKKHGKREGWDDAGRKGHRSRSSGIRYTGRS
ncbi:MAG: hypothetical protein PVG72_06625 [Gammaproteobacteria bacterium]